MSRPHRWRPTVTGEQVITLTFTVSYEATGNCYSDPGQCTGPVEQCYEPESEVEIDHMGCVQITDEAGEVIPEDSDIGKTVMAALDIRAIEQQMMDTSPNDYIEEREYEPS